MNINDYLPSVAIEDRMVETELSLEEMAVEKLYIDQQDASDDLTSLHVAAAGLENLLDTLEVSIESEALVHQAPLIDQVYGAYTQSIGIEGDETNFGLEAATAAEPQAPSSPSGDGFIGKLNGTIKRIWEAIKNAIKRFWNSLMAFFDKLFTSVDKVKKHNGDLMKQVQDLSTDIPQAKEITIHRASKLSFEGKCTPEQVVKGLAMSELTGKQIFDKFLPLAEDYYVSNTNLVETLHKQAMKEGGETAEADFEKATEELDEKLSASRNEFSNISTGRPVLLGEYFVPNIFSKMASAPGAMGLTIPNAFYRAKIKLPDESVTVKTPTKGILMSILKHNATILDMMAAKKGNIKKLRDARSQAVTVTDGLIKDYERGAFKSVIKKGTTRLAMQRTHRELTGLVTQYCSLNFTAIRAAQNLVKDAIAAY